MPNPQFTKPWHGIPRENIEWNPTIIEDACIGCGTCVTGCSRLVYRFDFERKKPVVIDPLNCMVGCTTCANTCPAQAIVFPPLESILALEGLPEVRHAVEDDLLNRRDILVSPLSIPHPDRIVSLSVSGIEPVSPEVIRVTLTPVEAGECFCEFSAGQYIELWQPGSSHLSRSYSIANAPHGDGSITLHIRRVESGRFTAWAFNEMKVGDQLQARGPLGSFTMRSAPDTPLLFIAGGTGLAPVLALLEQQVTFSPERDMRLVWGMKHAADFYALDTLHLLASRAPNLKVVLAAEDLTSFEGPTSKHLDWIEGNVLDAMEEDNALSILRDLYIAGPPAMLREIARDLDRRGVSRERVHMDSFGV
ncbi:FAD-binding oxidoreductase [Halomonas sp. ATCH28]|uniref:FAD-binding oxidoreductase n=1 Tax=Halomonas gemina TaxID=2945105 RepID=A0ABT0T1H9_9GAMM|nr:FAD-binding oxidoreductase [Halomonas gemina]MCL7940771.1 FAD-binding oxidoreductase [Halomonas gemina]